MKIELAELSMYLVSLPGMSECLPAAISSVRKPLPYGKDLARVSPPRCPPDGTEPSPCASHHLFVYLRPGPKFVHVLIWSDFFVRGQTAVINIHLVQIKYTTKDSMSNFYPPPRVVTARTFSSVPITLWSTKTTDWLPGDFIHFQPWHVHLLTDIS